MDVQIVNQIEGYLLTPNIPNLVSKQSELEV